MVTDSRGRAVPVYDLARRWQSPDPEAELPKADFDELRRRFIDRGFLGLGLPRWMFWGLAMLYGGLVLAVVVLGAPRPAVVGIAGALVLVYLAYGLTHRNQVPTPPAEELAAALLELGRCPSCAYDLRRAPRDEMGAAVCPECGAAWRMA